MATHSSISCLENFMDREPGGLQSMGSQRGVHDWTHTHTNLDLGKLSTGSGLPWWLRRQRIACNVGDLGSIPGLGRYLGGGYCKPFQYSFLPGESLTEDTGRLQSMGSQRVRHDWATQHSTAPSARNWYKLRSDFQVYVSINLSIYLSISVSVHLSSIYLIHYILTILIY